MLSCSFLTSPRTTKMTVRSKPNLLQLAPKQPHENFLTNNNITFVHSTSNKLKIIQADC